MGLVAAVASGCNSPLQPGECRDGHDAEGRTPYVRLQAACVPAGADVQCHVDRVESGYCAGPTRDVTSVARWISTDTSVAAFNVPGHLQARASGGTVIYAEFDMFYSPQAFGYQINPAGTPQQVGVVDVSVWQTTTGGFLPLAIVEFSPQTGGPQTCQQGVGAPYTPCRFWSDLSPAVVRASKPGYTTVQQTVTPTTMNLSVPTGVVLRLAPSQ
jgi:hypothetical protein